MITKQSVKIREERVQVVGDLDSIAEFKWGFVFSNLVYDAERTQVRHSLAIGFSG